MRSPSRTAASGPPTRRLGRDVQHDRAEGGARHARVRDADHVLDAGLRQLLRDRQIAGFRHARRVRSGVLQHEHIARRDVERRIVDAGGEILEAREDDRPTLGSRTTPAWRRRA